MGKTYEVIAANEPLLSDRYECKTMGLAVELGYQLSEKGRPVSVMEIDVATGNEEVVMEFNGGVF